METTIAAAVADTDYDLEGQVRDAILAIDAVRGTRAEVLVTVQAGHVTLDGVVQSEMAAIEVERAAEAVPGVRAVTNNLIDDATLVRRVAEALAEDARTSSIPPGYSVNSTFGHLRITGYFTGEQARGVLAVAQAASGVHAVSVQALD